MSIKNTTAVHIRWLIRRDMPDVLKIESQSFAPENQWTEDDFLKCLRQRNCIGMVAERGDSILGFMLYLLERRSLDLITIAVHPDFRRQGIGSAMLDRMYSKLSPERRSEIHTVVSELNVDAHLWLRQCGYRAIGIAKGFFANHNHDGYRFIKRYSLEHCVGR